MKLSEAVVAGDFMRALEKFTSIHRYIRPLANSVFERIIMQ